jgi:hypothetical protein
VFARMVAEGGFTEPVKDDEDEAKAKDKTPA